MPAIPKDLGGATRPCAGGFSLLELLVAATLMTVGVAGLGQLFIMARHANHSAKATTVTAVLARQKMEQLRGLTWGFDSLGLPVSDTTTDTTAAGAAGGGTGLTSSPATSLEQNVSGFCDFLDATGASLAGGSVPPAGTMYVRRWSIEPLPADPGNTLVLQVRVTLWRGHLQQEVLGGSAHEAHLISVKTRKAT